MPQRPSPSLTNWLYNAAPKDGSAVGTFNWIGNLNDYDTGDRLAFVADKGRSEDTCSVGSLPAVWLRL